MEEERDEHRREDGDDRDRARQPAGNAPGAGGAAPQGAGSCVVPDSCVPLLGYRTWATDQSVHPWHAGRGLWGHAAISPPRPLLASVFMPCVWPSGNVMHAICSPASSMRAMKHATASPEEDCMCGIYAHNDPCEVPGMGVPHSQQVHGVVRGWGKVVLHQKGWRAAVAQIAALLDPGPEAKNRDYVYEAAFVYDVPVIEGLGALKAFVDRGGEA